MNSRYFIGLIVLLLAACKTTQPLQQKQVTAQETAYLRTFHKGVRLKMMGQFPEAIAAFDSCYTFRQNDDAVAFALAQCYLYTNDQTKATTFTEAAAKLDPTNIWYTQELAYMYFNQNKFAESEVCFRKLVAKEPKNTDWLFGHSEVLKRLNKVEEAIAVLNKMEDQLGIIPDLSLQKYDLYNSIKASDKALNELLKARKVYPDELSLIGTLVEYYFQKNEIGKAQEMLVELVRNDPTNARANIALGDLYYRQFKKKEAYTYFKAAFEGVGLDIDTKMKVLLLFYEQQNVIEPEVFELAEILIATNPTDAKAYSVHGDLLLQNNKKQAALQAYKKALTFESTKYPIWNQVLLLEYESRNFTDLYTDSKACLALFPAIVTVHLMQTIACVQTGKYQEALDAAEIGRSLINEDPITEAEFYAQIGEAYFRLNYAKLGKENYQKALQFDQTNYLTKNNFALRLARSGSDLDLAEKLIDEVINTTEKTAAFYTTKAVVKFAKESYNEALAIAEIAVQLDN
ncbi:MAG: tetratricopeptide repeat protein, partial [Fluviicola sp.]|nr:tetratricopeptide repeat protein [Fluviicola sp.]